ncbi:MAG TPA: hypothetical protein DCL54_04575 [Alphaproteobacteria bacterium]|nr:hypothetical protein [Alphaproteobacteria bacterium]
MNKYIALAAVAACFSPLSAFAEPPSYPLICKGGPGMRMMVNHDVPDGVNTGATHMTVFFQAAGVAANPGPGQCVWMDRTFRPGEPESFKLKGNVEFAFQVYGNGRLARDGSGWRLSPEGSGPEAQDWKEIVDGMLNGGTFTVQVYNAGSTMLVTRVGP